MTRSQRAALDLAARSGGEIIIGGPDGQKVRRDVVVRLALAGFFRNAPSPYHSENVQRWTLTEKGRAILAGGAA